MKKVLVLALGVFLIGAVSSCGLGLTKLNDDLVKKYIAAYKVMQDKGVSSEGEGVDDKVLDEAAKQAGFKDLNDFMMVQASVLAAYSIIASQQYIDTMEEMQSPEYDKWKEIFDNPDIPEEQKAEAKKEMEKAKAEWEKNKKVAEPVMGFVSSLIDKDSAAVVKKYEKELGELFTQGMGIQPKE
ncbi:MAG: hypothetical protein HPY53_15990 [Brevinematales bacterium]|nr:hypothetical protein [Brevinematales bacterium]